MKHVYTFYTLTIITLFTLTAFTGCHEKEEYERVPPMTNLTTNVKAAPAADVTVVVEKTNAPPKKEPRLTEEDYAEVNKNDAWRAKMGPKAQQALRTKIRKYSLQMYNTIRPKYETNIVFTNEKGETRKFQMDCDGFCHAIYFLSGVVLLPEKEVQIVPRLHKLMTSKGKIYRRTRPNVGDIIFFDNTWERYENNRYDDELSHVGIVLNVDHDGRIEFIHISTSGVVINWANLEYWRDDNPDGTYANSYLGEWKESDTEKRKVLLACNLINSFGALFDVPKEGYAFKRVKQRDKRNRVIGITTKFLDKKQQARIDKQMEEQAAEVERQAKLAKEREEAEKEAARILAKTNTNSSTNASSPATTTNAVETHDLVVHEETREYVPNYLEEENVPEGEEPANALGTPESALAPATNTTNNTVPNESTSPSDETQEAPDASPSTNETEAIDKRKPVGDEDEGSRGILEVETIEPVSLPTNE